MDRYLIEGLIRDLHAGKFVVLVAPTLKQSGNAHLHLADELQDSAHVRTIRRTNGNQSIEMHNGGRLKVIAADMNAGRGFNADTIVTLDIRWMTDRQQDAVAEYAAVTHAELVHA